MKTNILKICVLGALLSIGACKGDPKPDPAPPSTTAVMIGNTGLTPQGSGTLTSYNPELQVPNNNAFQKANTYTMGPGLNSMLVDGDKTFLVMSGNAEIVVVNTSNYKVIKRFTGFGTPRHIVKASSNKYYVTDWQDEGVHVLYYNQTSPSKFIYTGLGPERMIIKDDLLFVANSGGPGTIADSTVSIINTKVDTITTELQVAFKPNSMQLDSRDQLWVLCAGFQDVIDPFASLPGELMSFDLSRDSLEYYPDSIVHVDTLSLVLSDNQLRPHDLVINKEGKKLYFIDNENGDDGNIMVHDVKMPMLTQAPYIQGFFYSLGYDMVQEELYGGSPGNYLLNGEVHRYRENGNQIDFFTAGIIPSCFGFK
ncbi:YncE family protein [Owenweeksia hongkongensis]|uniref:YncE family protein n=1 Tax=Owenweeksia hongkongensis TaxID=253245 RepID=UPI003A8CC555